MRSRDLARLAGVSVRTLRHYHQIGLLPEPARSANGYRLYTASDLIRVLRARRLVDLGVPLSRIDPAMDIDAELTLLDQDYARRIADLRRRREAIAAVRRRDARVDTPAFAQLYLSALGEQEGLPSQSVETERDASVLLEAVLDAATITRLGLLAEERIERLADVAVALLGLPDDASSVHVDDVADALASALRQLMPVISAGPPSPEAARSLEDHVDDRLPPVQREAIRRALSRLTG